MNSQKDIEKICLLDKNWKSDNIKIERVGGQTNRNYLVKYKNSVKFVRLAWEASDIVNREVEAKNVLALANCKKLVFILPKYYLYIFQNKNILNPKEKIDLANGTMVMEYINGKDINGKDLENLEIQEALLKTLYIFHSSGVRFVNSYDVFRDEVFKYKNKAKQFPINELITEQEIKNIEQVEKRIGAKLQFTEAMSTHNDLIFENLRLAKNNRVYLLDFEYAGFNIRDGLHYDLGIILGGNLFQKKPIKIKTYQEIIKKASLIYGQELSSYKVYCGALTNILVMFWWGLVKYFTCEPEEKEYFEKYVLDRTKGIKFLFDFIRNKNGD